jgi:hypothetical protein
MCQSHVYQCGDCVDNDGDGLVDMNDPDCLGPCDNNESGFTLNIPGGNAAPCKQDCYFDQDTGSGNDDCYWDHRCDPLEVMPSYDPEGMTCSYDPSTKFPMGLGTCPDLFQTQSAACLSYCGPLTPNGCDCFGCCDLPGGSGNYVWLGSTDANGVGTCDLAHEADPTACHPCTPVMGCLNTCEHCEICLGKPELPPDCTGTGAGGTSSSQGGGSSAGGSSTSTGGSSSSTGGSSAGGECGNQICPAGVAQCGLPCQAPCPSGFYCLTGCCIEEKP